MESKDLFDEANISAVLPGPGDYHLPPPACQPRLLRELLLVVERRYHLYALPLHPASSGCASLSCRDPLADDPLSESLPPGEPGGVVSMPSAMLADLVGNVFLDLRPLAALAGLGSCDGHQVPLRLVRSSLDPCLDRVWLVFPDTAWALIRAVVDRCVAPPGLGAADILADPVDVFACVDALDAAGRVQLAVVGDDPAALIADALAAESTPLVAEGVPFDVAIGDLGNLLSLHVPPPIASARLSAWSSLWEVGSWSQLVSVRAHVSGLDTQRQWQLSVGLECQCGRGVPVTLEADDAALFAPRQSAGEFGSLVDLPWNWAPDVDDQARTEVSLWARSLSVVDDDVPLGWPGPGPDHVVCGVVDGAHLCASPLDGTRYWRLDVTVPFVCGDPLCALARQPTSLPVAVYGRWTGGRVAYGDHVQVSGRLVVDVGPADRVLLLDRLDHL
jgi:hypothetical protein